MEEGPRLLHLKRKKAFAVKNVIHRLLKVLTEHARALAQVTRNELPGHLMAAVIVEAAVLGHLGWSSVALFLLATGLVRHR